MLARGVGGRFSFLLFCLQGVPSALSSFMFYLQGYRPSGRGHFPIQTGLNVPRCHSSSTSVVAIKEEQLTSHICSFSTRLGRGAFTVCF